MGTLRGTRDAFGHPGMEPRWARGSKDGVGTAYSASTKLWFTLWKGIVTECYWPTVDRPQLRDLQFLVSDGETFVHDEIHDLECDCRLQSIDHALGYRAHGIDPEGRYNLYKEIITDPHLPCLLIHTRVEGNDDFLNRLKLYVLCAPHMEVSGWGNSAFVMESAGRQILVATKKDRWLALAATHPFSKLSVGFVGQSDGWQDVQKHKRLEWEFDRAEDGNVALIGELSLAETREFTLGLAFGETLHAALTALFQSLATPFDQTRTRYVQQWDRAAQDRAPLAVNVSDNGQLYNTSCNILLAHEDKTYQGALIASLSIPWGQTRGDDDVGGYHLVWTRDMVTSSMAILASGHVGTPLRSLVYLAVSQASDGSFPQNFWIDGQPHWTNQQLDEVAAPILLAHRLWREMGTQGFNTYPMVERAARYLMQHGPVTQQERWEEVSGFSPSTLAVVIAGLICAADMARASGGEDSAREFESCADFFEANVDLWTTTDRGTILADVPTHYVRIRPAQTGAPLPTEPVRDEQITIASRPPGTQWSFPARDIVDAGFLELVRYGIRKPTDPLIVNSLRVVDASIKVDTPFGPSWRRYTQDSYGQRDDGSAFEGYGRGRAWPLLTGERAHYELAAGGDAHSLRETLEKFAGPTGLLSEQVWDAPDLPEEHMKTGFPTGAATPLCWAHAEYIKLLRSIRDGQVFDVIPPVAARYANRP